MPARHPLRAGVSVAIFGIFSCTTLKSGASYLDADFTIMCYDKTHWRYIGGAIVWLILVPCGIPAFFIWLLRRFKVPQMARLHTDNAWLREVAKMAWQEGMAQPPSDMSALSIHGIGDAHLEALYAFFCQDASAEEATEIMTGARPPVMAQAQQAQAEQGKVVRLLARVTTAVAQAARGRTSSSGDAADAGKTEAAAPAGAALPPEAARRALVLHELLLWARTSGDLSIPVLVWEDMEEEEAGAHAPACAAIEEDAPAKAAESAAVPAAHALHADGVTTAELPELQRRAMREVGFLFSVYRVDCWYWETVELLRKLALTSILALIAPGSAGQVVSGLLIAFVLLVWNLHTRPFAEEGLNTVNQIAQLNLVRRCSAHLRARAAAHCAACPRPQFFVLLVALLLKVNLDGEGGSRFFGGIVGVLIFVPVALPILLKLYVRFFGDTEMRMLVNDSTWE